MKINKNKKKCIDNHNLICELSRLKEWNILNNGVILTKEKISKSLGINRHYFSEYCKENNIDFYGSSMCNSYRKPELIPEIKDFLEEFKNVKLIDLIDLTGLGKYTVKAYASFCGYKLSGGRNSKFVEVI